MQKDYIVFSLDLANYLIENNIKLIKTIPSKRNKGKLVFIFPDNQDTLSKIEEYKLSRNQ
jgi:hypothetical protein